MLKPVLMSSRCGGKQQKGRSGWCRGCFKSFLLNMLFSLNLQGPKGAKGDQGSMGIMGQKGETGEMGSAGPPVRPFVTAVPLGS